MKKHHIYSYHDLVKKSCSDLAWYWDAVNQDLGLEWFKKYDTVFDASSGIPWTKWFINGKCNIISNAIDRHSKNQPDKVAYVFENSDGNVKKLTYGQLDKQVSALASALRDAGIKKGDVVAIYLPTIPEAFISAFACSKIGAIHNTVFSGFGGQALRTRLLDSNAKLLITTDSFQRRSKTIDLKSQWKSAMDSTLVKKVISIDGEDDEKNKVVSYDRFISNNYPAGTSTVGKLDIVCPTEIMDSEDPLFILYTSGTTGKPKGTIQVHGGYSIVAAQQTAYLIDMNPDDVLFWYADIGWITGQTWVVYGSPIVGGTSLVYSDAIDYPEKDVWCKLIEKHNVSIFGVAPTAIRLFMQDNVKTDQFGFKSLRVLACTGEPINKEAWLWYFNNVGKSRCPVINLAGGTEIGGAIVSSLSSIPLKPSTVGCPVPGIDADIFDDAGNSVTEGYLVIKKPWPSMSRGILNNNKKFLDTYWSKYANIWYHGDIVRVDADGYWYMCGRTDDVIKVSGHRIGTAEIESAILSHPAVAEVVVVGIPHEIKGESIVACIVLKNDCYSEFSDKVADCQILDISGFSEKLTGDVMKLVEESVGRFARPDQVRIVSELPKTATGKLVRRLVRAKISNTSKEQDLSGIENPDSIEKI